jgi:peptide/nickel transport system substrate-binding protein
MNEKEFYKMEEKRILSRRAFMKLTVVAAVGAAAAACQPQPTPTAAPKPTTAPAATAVPTKPPAAATSAPAATAAPASKYKEAPMLAEMVKAGKLPAVDKRLPDNPWVAPTLESVGKHGGQIRRAYKGVSDRWGPTKLQDRGFVWFDKSLVMKPRLAESWTVNADGTEWSIKLRKGSKWSDGKEFTSADVKWWWENWVNNKLLTPSGPTGVLVAGSPPKPLTPSFPDAYTVNLKFPAPKPMFITLIGRYQMYMPGHYLKEWHMDLTSDKAGLEAKVKAAGSASWDRYLVDDRQYWYANPDLPTVGAWTSKEPLGKDLHLMIRNPYFYGVDSAGNQLPYWDQVTHRLFSDNNVFNLWITNGEIDFQARHVSSAAADVTLYKQGETKGDYKVFRGISAGHLAVQLNLATKEAKLREFFNNRDVRIGLSYAIDRNKINELVYSGLATPRQYSPISASPQFYKKLSEAHIKFDVAEANKRLDASGYKDKDAQGFRKFKDGTTISFTIEGTDNVGTPSEDAYQQIVKMFGAVGVKCAYKYAERALYEQHYNANEIEAAVWGGDRTVLPLVPEAPIFRGTMIDRPWAAGYGHWYTDKTAPGSVEPPKDHFIWKIWEIWDKVAAEPDPAKQNALFFQILDIWAEELPMIGVLGEVPSFCIVKNGIKNFIQGFPNDDTTGDEQVYNAETYYWDDPSKHPVT